MKTEFIKYHPGSNTYIIQKKAYFEDSVLLKGNLIVGAGCNFWQELRVEGDLELGKNSLVKGHVQAHNALIGPHCEINGDVQVDKDLTLMNNVNIAGSATCGGQMLVRPGCSMGFVKAEKVLELVGKVNIKDVEAGTKVIVRSE
ncbi:polymer-forming cytoskeletal protein [Methanomethylovorans sp. PtaU1.Bin093]|uniref:polymer-forming cytoskeletal protein n=1 Tax=Methanomethylovorans sp. PtaU1.Bin093 TaxID=1811679 RepID=UPI0025FCBE8F|nr:polymer-forming cytoskeletal protein [Methanomethylovorans sp. PtaU1.Bin093]